jgi:hypothetical protein
MSVDPGVAALDGKGRSVVDDVLALLPLVQAKRAQDEEHRMAGEVVEALGRVGCFVLFRGSMAPASRSCAGSCAHNWRTPTRRWRGRR